MTKVCSKCGVEKDVSEFWKNKMEHDGIQRNCIFCIKQYRNINKDKIKKINNKSYLKHQNENLERSKAYRNENKEKIRASNKEYESKNKDKKNEWSRKCYLKNREKRRARGEMYYIENRDYILKKNKIRYENNKDEILKINRYKYRNNTGECKDKKNKRIVELCDKYVMDQLVFSNGIDRNCITDTMIDLKRAQLKLYRAINHVCD